MYFNQDMENAQLEHHGVKSMRWGVRRSTIMSSSKNTARRTNIKSSVRKKNAKIGAKKIFQKSIRSLPEALITAGSLYIAAKRDPATGVLFYVATKRNYNRGVRYINKYMNET